MRTIGRKLAEELGRLSPIMRRGPDVECCHCTDPIRTGDTYWLKTTDDHGDDPICYRCGCGIVTATGQMTYRQIRGIEPIGGPPRATRTEDGPPAHRPDVEAPRPSSS